MRTIVSELYNCVRVLAVLAAPLAFVVSGNAVDYSGDGISDTATTVTPTQTQEGLDDYCGREYGHTYDFTGSANTYYIMQGRIGSTWGNVAYWNTAISGTSVDMSWCDSENCGYYSQYRLIECGGTSISSLTAVTVPSSRGRTNVGVDEIITFALSPAPSSGVTWSISGGGTLYDETQSSASWVAPDTAATASVTATLNGLTYSITFSVVTPENPPYMAQATGSGFSGVFHTNGVANIGFYADTYLTPDDVSFTNLYIREGSVNALGTGYFSYQNGNTHPDGYWIPPNPPTSGKGSYWGTDNVTGSTDGHTPFSTGLFQWDIPLYYKAGSTGTEHQFGSVLHEKTFDSSGNIGISKGGVSASKNISDPSSTY